MKRRFVSWSGDKPPLHFSSKLNKSSSECSDKDGLTDLFMGAAELPAEEKVFLLRVLRAPLRVGFLGELQNLVIEIL